MPREFAVRDAVLDTVNCVEPACTTGVETVGTGVAGVNAASLIPREGATGGCTRTLVGDGAGPVLVNCRLCTEPLASKRKSKRLGKAAILTRFDESASCEPFGPALSVPLAGSIVKSRSSAFCAALAAGGEVRTT